MGAVMGTGLIPRDWSTHPRECFAVAPAFPDNLIIPQNEWKDRWHDLQAASARLPDLRAANYDTLKSYDQNGYGLCWAFSSTKAATYLRVQMGLPPARLAPYWVAGKVKGWRDEGGWGGESMTEIAQAGIPLESFCTSYSSSHDTPEAAANAAFHKVVKWYDGTEDPQRNWEIMMSAHLQGMVPVNDYNWLSHSMCGCYYDPDTDCYYCDNSWGDTSQFGPQGLYKITGRHMYPDGVVVAAVIEGSVS